MHRVPRTETALQSPIRRDATCCETIRRLLVQHGQVGSRLDGITPHAVSLQRSLVLLLERDAAHSSAMVFVANFKQSLMEKYASYKTRRDMRDYCHWA